MKFFTTTLAVLLLLLNAQSVSANEIDNLKTTADVQKFLEKNVNKDWKDERIFDKKDDETDNTCTTALADTKFFKLDLDSNGLTDLLVNGKYLFAVMDNGNGNYERHFIDRGTFLSQKFTLLNIIYMDSRPLLVVCNHGGNLNIIQTTDSSGNISETSRYWDIQRLDTLIFTLNRFVEYNPQPDNLDIKEIHFSTTGCYGTCPIFELTIKNDRRANFNAIEYNKINGHDFTGWHGGTIDADAYNKLVETINYIRLNTLRDNYRVNWTDDQTVTLQVEFSNGQTKKISDYGAIGTFGLQNLYNQLFALRKTQKWE